MDLGGTHVHTALNHRDSYCLEYRTKMGQIIPSSKHNILMESIVPKTRHVQEDLQN
jgi:hypothetical protein